MTNESTRATTAPDHGNKEQMMTNELIEAGALRQFQHNDGSGLTVGYDIAITDREFARLHAQIGEWKEAYANMKQFAEGRGLDTTTRGAQQEPK